MKTGNTKKWLRIRSDTAKLLLLSLPSKGGKQTEEDSQFS